MERIYAIPLRDVKKVPKGKRTVKMVRFIKGFLKKHMKGKAVLIDEALNERIWEYGIRNIPPNIKVKAEKLEDGNVIATLPE